MRSFFRELSRHPAVHFFRILIFEVFFLRVRRLSLIWLFIRRGYFLTDPNQGDVLYRDVVRRLSETLRLNYEEVVEQESFEWLVRPVNS